MKTNRQEWEGEIPRYILDVWEEKKGAVPSNTMIPAMYLIPLVLVGLSGAFVFLACLYGPLVMWATPPGQKPETGLCSVVCGFMAAATLGISLFLIHRILETREKKRLRLLEFRRFVERFAKCVSYSDAYFNAKTDELEPIPFSQICDDSWCSIVKGVFTDQEMTGELFCFARLRFKAKQFVDHLADEVVVIEAMRGYCSQADENYPVLNGVHKQRRGKLLDQVSWATTMKLVDESLADIIMRSSSRLIDKSRAKPPEEKKEPPKPEIIAALPKRVVEIRCPVDGIFHRRPDNEQPPFVEVRSSVTPDSLVGRLTRGDGQNLHITAGVTGQITLAPLPDGQDAKIGDILFMVESTEPEK